MAVFEIPALHKGAAMVAGASVAVGDAATTFVLWGAGVSVGTSVDLGKAVPPRGDTLVLVSAGIIDGLAPAVEVDPAWGAFVGPAVMTGSLFIVNVAVLCAPGTFVVTGGGSPTGCICGVAGGTPICLT